MASARPRAARCVRFGLDSSSDPDGLGQAPAFEEPRHARFITSICVKHHMLPEFLEWLHERYAIDRHYIQNKDDTGFYTRFYIQKSVYIAQHLGLEAGYRYNQHVYGPYSRDLAHDYYAYDPNMPIDGSPPTDFGRIGDAVLRARSRGLAWMEVATTILQDARERGDEGGRYFRDVIEGSVAEQKCQYTDGYVRAVYDDLLKTRLGEGLPTEGSGPAAIRARHE